MAPDYGGAIHAIGGNLALESCPFTNFVARLAGGAVCGERLESGAYISKCTFYDNKSHPINGYGGALYLTKRKGATGSAGVSTSAGTFVGGEGADKGAVTHDAWPHWNAPGLNLADETQDGRQHEGNGRRDARPCDVRFSES